MVLTASERHFRSTPNNGHLRLHAWVRLVPIGDITAIHSITSSARASSESGTVNPSALAVLRLIWSK